MLFQRYQNLVPLSEDRKLAIRDAFWLSPEDLSRGRRLNRKIEATCFWKKQKVESYFSFVGVINPSKETPGIRNSHIILLLTVLVLS